MSPLPPPWRHSDRQVYSLWLNMWLMVYVLTRFGFSGNALSGQVASTGHFLTGTTVHGSLWGRESWGKRPLDTPHQSNKRSYITSSALCTHYPWAPGPLWKRLFVAWAPLQGDVESSSHFALRSCYVLHSPHNTPFLTASSAPLPHPSARRLHRVFTHLCFSSPFPGTITGNTFELKGVHLKKKKEKVFSFFWSLGKSVFIQLLINLTSKPLFKWGFHSNTHQAQHSNKN